LAAGSALAESVYAYLAFWGFGALLASHPWLEPISRGAAAVILIALGLHFMRKRPPDKLSENGSQDHKSGNKRMFVLGITITALNPTLMATWGAAVTTLHSLDFVSFQSNLALPFSIGVFLGITGWFSLLLWLLVRFKGRFERSTVDRIVRVMGLLLTGLGLFFAARFANYFHEHARSTRSSSAIQARPAGRSGGVEPRRSTVWFDDDLDATVFGPTITRVVVAHRAVGAHAHRADGIGGDAARDQKRDDGLRALLG
jgi:threonine/homoserine/homoserine lactone efflux protein